MAETRAQPSPRAMAKKTAKKTRAAKRSARFASAASAPRRPAPRSGRASTTRDDDMDYAQRSDKQTGELAVVEMISRERNPARDIMAKLHDIIMEAVPDMEPAIKWGMPAYSKGGMVCYSAPYDAYVRFGFYHARSKGLEGLDAGSGDGGHVKYARAGDVDKRDVVAWVKKASSA